MKFRRFSQYPNFPSKSMLAILNFSSNNYSILVILNSFLNLKMKTTSGTVLTKLRVWPGRSYPLGATWDGCGVNFAIFSESAVKGKTKKFYFNFLVELCLFECEESDREYVRIQMPEYTDHVWHCYLPDTRPGQLYGKKYFKKI